MNRGGEVERERKDKGGGSREGRERGMEMIIGNDWKIQERRGKRSD